MKDTLNFWLLLSFMTFIASCSSGGEEIDELNPTPSQPTITLETSSSSNFTTEGGNNIISFKSSDAWTADVINSRADTWCSVSPTSGDAGNAKITITTTPNVTPDDRSASIVIKAGSTQKTINVSQKQKDALTVTSSKFEVTAEGGEVKVEVKANIKFDYEIDTAAKEWISYSETRALKTSTLVFNVAKNEIVQKREGKISIKSGEYNETIMIYQSGTKPEIVISKDEYIVSSGSETISLEVASNVDVAMEIPSDATWISENSSRALSTNTFYFDILPNEDYDQRSTEIKFTNKENGLSETIKVVQMQKDAIVLAKSNYDFEKAGGYLDFEIQTNVDISVSISSNAQSWIQQLESRGLVTKALYFNIAFNETTENREGTITIAGGNATQQVITVRQNCKDEIYEKERATLIALYKALNGDNWVDKNNWCSDRPLKEWSGVSVNEDGYVEKLNIRHRNIQGAIPECIGQLSQLKYLDAYDNAIVGPLPNGLADCKHLQYLDLANNPMTGAILPEYWGKHMENLEYLGIYNTQLGGELPQSIGSMKSMKKLFLASNKISGSIPESIGQLPAIEELLLSGNNLTGSIPESMANLPKLKDFTLHSNNFQGSIPEAFQQTDNWKNFWPNILDNNDFNISNVRFYGPSFKDVKTLDGKTISDEIYSKNKLTILCTWLEWGGTEYLDALKEMYAKYKDMGLEIICYSKERDINVIKNFLQKNSIEWTTFSVEENKDKFLLKNTYYPFANIIAPSGEIINTSVYSSIEEHFPKDLFIELEYDKYESTDYSKDGEVKKLQTATKGNGIDIILMGDAFCDTHVADGTYDKVMNTAMEKFFEEEPYKSFRDHFNVYSVTTVSKHGILGEHYGKKYEKYSESALDAYHLLGTSKTGGNDDKVLEYANKTGISQLLNCNIIVIINSPEYGGTCFMYMPMPDETGDWGQGLTISYFPMGKDDEALKQVLNHEAGGHGFAKLADEYAYQDYGSIPSEEIHNYKFFAKYGWYKNVDFTNELNQIKWYHFLKDNRYDNEGLGAYEGACTYWTGAWRPTQNSIMRHNTGGFNAPSREAIYYRIHKMAYGDDWQYNYEDFVEYDAINRKTSVRSVNYVEMPKDFKPLHAPIVKRYSKKYGK